MIFNFFNKCDVNKKCHKLSNIHGMYPYIQNWEGTSYYKSFYTHPSVFASFCFNGFEHIFCIQNVKWTAAYQYSTLQAAVHVLFATYQYLFSNGLVFPPRCVISRLFDVQAHIHVQMDMHINRCKVVTAKHYQITTHSCAIICFQSLFKIFMIANAIWAHPFWSFEARKVCIL